MHLAPVIHVAGTNGKGSTIAFLNALASAGGLRVHAFTKPHLHRLNERFVVTRPAGANCSTIPIEDDALINCAERIAAIDRGLTQFDAQVAAAFLLFSEFEADLVLLEAGMGGRDDSTNVVPAPVLAVLTPIDLDHVETLGPTLADIARHKAGIIKAGAKAISARQTPEVMSVLKQQADLVGAKLYIRGRDWDASESNGGLVVQTEFAADDFPPPILLGPHQWDNAGLAAAALMLLDPPNLDRGRYSGMMLAHHPGRLQAITDGPLKTLTGEGELWIDGAHNVLAAQALSRALAELHKKRPAKTALIIGMRARKDWRAFVKTLAPSAAITIAIPLSAESADPEALAQAAREAGAHALTAPDLYNAISAALANGAGRILICGSFLLAAAALRGPER